jgi:hypothetical protein
LTSHADPLLDSFTHFLSVVAGFIFMIYWARLIAHVAPRESAGEDSDGHQSKVQPTHTETLFRRTTSQLAGPLQRRHAARNRNVALAKFSDWLCAGPLLLK